METLWDAGDGWRTVREVHDVLVRDRDIAYTTVMTVLDRMARKDRVEREREAALVAFVGEASDADRQALREALATLERRSRA